jgi:hypothetical protein
MWCARPRQFCTCTTFRPIVETCYHKEKCLTFVDVQRTAFKREMHIEAVPVTKLDCITVDEGCYKMVWVPNLRTKTIARTELHQRVGCHTVPVQINCKQPVVTEHLVPHQRVRYVAETHTFEVPQPDCAIPRHDCGAPWAPGVGPSSLVPAPGVTMNSMHSHPVPDPHYLDVPHVSDAGMDHYEQEVIVQQQTDEPNAAASFAAPSAAAAWGARAGLVRR